MRTGSFFEPSQAIWLSRCLMPGIAETRQHRGDVVLDVEARRLAEARREILGHEQFDELRQLLVAHRIGDGLVAAQQAEIGERGMRAVDQAQLGAIVDADVLRERDADRLPVGVAHRRHVFDHPLRERLALDGPLVDDAGERLARACAAHRRWPA